MSPLRCRYSDDNEAAEQSAEAAASASSPSADAPGSPTSFEFGLQRRLEIIRATHKLNIDSTIKTRKKYQSKLIKLLSDNPALQDKARLYEGVTFYS